MNGKSIYLIPSSLGDEYATIPQYVREITYDLDCFIVENLRSARRFLRTIGYTKDFDTEVQFFELNKHDIQEHQLFQFLNKYTRIGLLSEAGNPCIADPGAIAVEMGHQLGFQIKPLVGPNSILLALIASGMNGQQFTFHGYLPIDNGERKKMLRQMESTAKQTGYTQVFMETPYRNDKLIDLVTQTCNKDTLMCIACDITLATEFIQTRKVIHWKKDKPSFHKRPAIFVMGK